jgi:mercuric ion binding protein
MRMLMTMAALAISSAALVGMAAPETKVEVKNVHICCGACEKAVGKILEDSGVKGTCDKKAKTVSFTADDAKAAQKALDGLAAGGFHGDTGNKDLAIKDDSGAKEGKITSATVKGFHNCCPACCKAIKAVLAKVEGVESEDTKPKETSCTVKGSFDAAKLVKALNDAGFHVTVEAGK